MADSFFERNTISHWTNEKNTQSASPNKVRSKRASSVANLNLNPSKFMHREVFNSKLYQKIHHFNLKLDTKQVKFQNTDLLLSIENLFRDSKIPKQEELKLHIQNINNHLKNLQPDLQRQSYRKMVNLTKNFYNLLKVLIRQIKNLQNSKREIQQNAAKIQLQAKIKSKLTVTEQSQMTLISFKQLEKLEKQRKQYKSFKEKYIALDFSNKKNILSVQNLKATINNQNKLIDQLQAQVNSLKMQRQSQKNFKQVMEYKLKQLREELQVAHIVKQQNLADKMKYIMNW